MAEEYPLVSIVTPAYNRGAFLDETIASVLSQDYPHIEYIVLDDGSTDDTQEVLKRYNRRITCVSHPNMGETQTVNKGLRLARGRFVGVVNSDDPLLDGAVRAAVDLMRNQPNVLAAYPDWLEIGPDSEPLREVLLPDYDLRRMLTEFSVSMGPGAFFRRSALEEVGLRDPAFRFAGDLEFWFRLALHGRLGHIPRTLATHRVHPDSASVTHCGQAMAGELIQLVRKVYAYPELPAELQELRRWTLTIAHHAAVSCCGADRATAWKHRLAVMWYGLLSRPAKLLVGWVLRKVAHWLYGLGWRTVRPFLRRHFSGGQQAADTPKRFAFVSHVLPPSWSGQAVVIRRLLEGIDPQTYCLVSRHDYDAEGQDFIGRLPAKYYHLPEELRIRRGGRYRIVRWFNGLCGIFQRGWNIAKVLKVEGRPAVVVGTGDLVDPFAAFVASHLAGCPFYLYMFDDYTWQWGFDPGAMAIARRFERIMVREAMGVIVVTDEMQEEVRRRHRLPPVLIRNPWETLGEAVQDAAEGDATEQITILFSGAVYACNCDALRNLTEAAAMIDSPKVTVHIYTAQPAQALADQGILNDHVVYHSHVPPAEIAQAQQSADILFLPLTFDPSRAFLMKTSSTGKLSDYLASGRPILAHVPAETYVCRYLETYRCGIVVSQDDPAGLAEAIRRLAGEPELRASLGRNARWRAGVDFAPDRARRRFLELLESSP